MNQKTEVAFPAYHKLKRETQQKLLDKFNIQEIPRRTEYRSYSSLNPKKSWKRIAGNHK